MTSIEDVRAFWDRHPLWTDDAQASGEPGTKAFFDSHTRAVLAESGGHMDQRLYPTCQFDDPVLDLGCGIGFWLEQFGSHGFTNLTGADLSERSLALAKQRCVLNGIDARFSDQNAQAMTFPDNTFAHVQCIGVIHHAPEPLASLREIRRVLAPEGRAVVAVYYKHAVLRFWPALRYAAMAAARLGFTPKGRGREQMMISAETPDELVRMYDGADNPCGMAFTSDEYAQLIEASGQWRQIEMFCYAFPARQLPISVPKPVFRTLEFALPAMLCAVLERR